MTKKKIVEYIFYLTIFLGGAITSWYLITLLLTKVGREVKIPNIIGKEIIEAWEDLQKEGLELAIESFIYTDNVPRYTIISQKPLGGKITKKGRRVYVKVSLGRKAYPVPDLIGLKLDDAYNLIKDSFFSIKKVAGIYSDNDKGTIISQYPPPGYEAKNKSISVLISLGSRNKFLTPAFRNKTIEEAKRIVSPIVKTLKIIRSNVYAGAPDLIQDQYPLPGFPLEHTITFFLPEKLEGLRVISLYLSPGLLKKFIEVLLRYDNIKMKIYKKGLYGGKSVYIMFPQSKGESMEVRINGKKVKKRRWSFPRSFHSLR